MVIGYVHALINCVLHSILNCIVKLAAILATSYLIFVPIFTILYNHKQLLSMLL